jgi:hypothetical protein
LYVAELEQSANGTQRRSLHYIFIRSLRINYSTTTVLKLYLSRSVWDQWYTTPRRRSICISDSQASVCSCRCFHLGPWNTNINISPALTDVVDSMHARPWCPNIYLSETETIDRLALWYSIGRGLTPISLSLSISLSISDQVQVFSPG